MAGTHGQVHWTELMTRDVAAAKAYYAAICGWTFETMPMESGDYHLGFREGQPVVGIMDLGEIPGMDGVPPHWFSYFAVDDLDAALEKTTAMGGTVQRPPFEVPGTGWIAIVTDPTGAAMGLMKPDPMDDTAG